MKPQGRNGPSTCALPRRRDGVPLGASIYPQTLLSGHGFPDDIPQRHAGGRGSESSGPRLKAVWRPFCEGLEIEQLPTHHDHISPWQKATH